MKRSLVLAGGGMRVAWQAGVLKALEEHEVTYDHVDGTSGGILNTAMVLSGLNADEVIARWARVKVSDFSAVLPWREYLKGPWNLPGLSSPEGMIDRLFPAMGVDVAAIRSSRLPGTFNIANFTEKRSIAIPHTEVDAPLLAAGMSLPIFTTPLKRDGVTWTDAAWIRDANVSAALEHGAEEVWLIWCVGNSEYWGDGPLEQYVHMIEMSATGGLLADFAQAQAAGRRFVLHVIKPEHPLPLDPVFYLGRISAWALAGMGYRDAVAYLEQRVESGVPQDASCTRMTEPAPGVGWSERLAGASAKAWLAVQVPQDRLEPGSVTGFISLPGRTYPIPLAAGQVTDDSGCWGYHGRVRMDGAWVPVHVTRAVPRGTNLLGRLNHAVMTVGDRSYRMRLTGTRRLALLASLEPVGVHGFFPRIAAVARTLVRLREHRE